MKQSIGVVFLVLFVSIFSGCVAQSRQRVSYTKAMNNAIAHYSVSARKALAPDFAKAHIAYPPKKLAFLVFKRSKKFEVYAKDRGAWAYIKTYPVLAASGHVGPKLREGDRQVPEGIYRIVGLNPRSRFDLSLHVNYPNAFDTAEAQLDARKNLGNNIFIHGDQRSIGCIALGNKVIQQLFPLVAAVGDKSVEVIIAPNDLRSHKATLTRWDPQWTPQLYQRIAVALQVFPKAMG